MRRAALAAAAAAALLLAAGCGGGGEPEEAADEGWAALAAGLAPGHEPGSENACVRGDPACLDALVAEMDARLERLEEACDHAAPFAYMYREVTAAVAAAPEGFFGDRPWLNHLDAVFAELYFRAFDAWRDGRGGDVPAAWRVAFEAADGRLVSAIGDMLLGMNAHISRDLPFALAAIGAGADATGKEDFDRVNELLRDVQGPMLAGAAERFDPTADDFSLPTLRLDETGVAALLAGWREEAWRNARALAAAGSADERRAVETAIETAAALRARAIRAATRYLPLLGEAEERDGYCASRR